MITHSESFDSSSHISVRVDGCSGTIVLNRGSRKNAISRSMLDQLQEAFGDLHQEKKVRGVILTGSGNVFSAGADLAEIKSSMSDDNAQAKWFADCMAQKELIEVMLRFPKPIIASVNGPALGLGAALVLASDVAVGTEASNFGFPETRRGLVPGIGAPLLAFRLGSAAAADFLLRSELANGKECMDIGLYRWLVSEDLAWAKADAIIRDLNGKDPTAISMTKRLLNETIGESLFAQLSAGAAATAAARTTEAAQEGINAFLSKRDPEWP